LTKFIEPLLKTIESELLKFAREYQIDNMKVALIGSMGVAAYGVELSTRDIDFLCYGDPYDNFSSNLFKFWEKRGKLYRKFYASRDPFDPLQHDFCRIKIHGEIVDFLIAAYQWEVTGLDKSPLFPGFSLLRVFSKPYLVISKLKAGGPKDLFQAQMLLKNLNTEEIQEVEKIARQAHINHQLQQLLKNLSTENGPKSRGPGGSSGPHP